MTPNGAAPPDAVDRFSARAMAVAFTFTDEIPKIFRNVVAAVVFAWTVIVSLGRYWVE
jgi:hypothetical protein